MRTKATATEIRQNLTVPFLPETREEKKLMRPKYTAEGFKKNPPEVKEIKKLGGGRILLQTNHGEITVAPWKERQIARIEAIEFYIPSKNDLYMNPMKEHFIGRMESETDCHVRRIQPHWRHTHKFKLNPNEKGGEYTPVGKHYYANGKDSEIAKDYNYLGKTIVGTVIVMEFYNETKSEKRLSLDFFWDPKNQPKPEYKIKWHHTGVPIKGTKLLVNVPKVKEKILIVRI